MLCHVAHTRSLRITQKATVQKGDSNALMQDSSERLHSKKESFANVIQMFKKQDEKEILKKDRNLRTIIKRYRPLRHYVHDYHFQSMPSDIASSPSGIWHF